MAAVIDEWVQAGDDIRGVEINLRQHEPDIILISGFPPPRGSWAQRRIDGRIPFMIA